MTELKETPFSEPHKHDFDARLHPVDVGFDVRTQATEVVLPVSERLRVTCPNEVGERVVLEGPRELVARRLHALGFKVAP